MDYLAQIAFLIVLGITSYLLYKRIAFIKKNISLGRPLDINDHKGERWRNVFLIAFGQKKMFKRIIPAFFHFLIYIGFLLINIEVLEIILDGILGTHRLFAPFLGGFYPVLISFFEFLALGVIAACVVFLFRRDVIKLPRFRSAEMKGWPTLDGNLILIIEIILMLAILEMNAADQVLQTRADPHYPASGPFLFSQWLVPLFSGFDTPTLIMIERIAWWLHIIGIFAFAVYVTYSKHLHIFMAFPNTYYSNLEPRGRIVNMPEVTNEVQIMLGMTQDSGAPPAEVGRFGAKDVNDLTWKNLMDAYSCTECGRCTSECPANQTGKKLSPRKVMMDTRDRMEEIGYGEKGLEDGKALLGDYVTKEELNACTTCNACVEACPINIDPLSIILQMRRYVAMEESATPPAWNAMFQNIETSFSPWKFAPTDRFNWSKELNQ